MPESVAEDAEPNQPHGSDPRSTVTIRPLREADLDSADRVFRLAFGTFIGLADPLTFAGDRQLIRTRWHADATAAFGAEVGAELAGSNFAAHWGSVGFFGPLTVRPDLWDRGIAKRLLEPVVGLFESWRLSHSGLFTFPESTKHIHLYQRFGFWPRFLTAIVSRPVHRSVADADWRAYSTASPSEQESFLRDCGALPDAL